jgi:hypothetical protein
MMLCLGACSTEQDNAVQEDFEAVHSDVLALVDSLDEYVVVVGDIFEQSTCQNDGSGPVRPGTTINVALRDGAALEDVRTSAEAALKEMGYDLTPDSVSWFIAKRRLSEDRSAEIEIIDSKANDYEMVFFTDLTPLIDC